MTIVNLASAQSHENKNNFREMKSYKCCVIAINYDNEIKMRLLADSIFVVVVVIVVLYGFREIWMKIQNENQQHCSTVHKKSNAL